MASSSRSTSTSKHNHNKALLGTNFFAGDVVQGLGPYLAIYLLSAYHWKPGGIGMALAAGSIATVIVQAPAGAIIDATTWKRTILAMCAVLIAAAASVIVLTKDPPWAIYSAQTAIGIACAFLAPAIAAVTLDWLGQSSSPPKPARTKPGTMPATCSAPPWARRSRSTGSLKACSG